jgi:hypothetical protein
MYTYDGNENETYYLYKDGRKIGELFLSEDETIELVQLLNK